MGTFLKHFKQFFQTYSFPPRYTRILFLIVTTIGIIRGLQHYYIVDAFEQVQFPLWWHIPFNVFLWWIWLLFVPLITWIHARLSNRKGTIIYWITLAFFAPLFIVFIRQLLASFVITEILQGYKNFVELIRIRLFSNVWIWLDYGMYYAILVSITIFDVYTQGSNTEKKLLELTTQLYNSQIKALESQIHPHFLFNTLNTLSTLLLKHDKVQTQRMLTLLQNYLSTTLKEPFPSEVSFAEELKSINDYLQIEKVRFQDRLCIEQQISEEALHAIVPRLLLQPIVENSLYHGIAPKKEGGTIRITATRENGWLSLSIEDDGIGVRTTSKKKHGIGLTLVRERLLRIYGQSHSFSTEAPPAGGFCVRIKLPYRLAQQPYNGT